MAVASLVAKVDAQVANFEKQFANITRTTQKFEKDFANTASSVTAQQRRISQAFETFSGDRLAREASAVAKAVEQLGGASKLTAAEQTKVNALVSEALAKYQALGQTAPKALTDLAQATKKVETTTAAIPKQLTLADKAAGLLSSTFGQFTAASLVSSALQGIVTQVGEFIAQGQKLPGLRGSFERLSAGIGQSSTGILAAMQGATRGLVSNLDLMQSANKAMLLGLPVTAQSIGDLSRAATTLGKAMGQDATKSLDDLITALGRSSPLILDNLGLTVKIGEANDAFAKKLGTSADSLTDSERKLAFYEAAMEAARKKTAELGEQTLTLSDRATQAWTAIGNVITENSATINTGLGRAISSTQEFGRFLQDVLSIGFAQATLHASLREQIAQTGGAAKKSGDDGAAAQRNYVKELQRTLDLMPRLTAEGRRQFEAAERLGVSAEEMGKAFGMSAKQVDLLRAQLKDTTKAKTEQSEIDRAITESMRKYAEMVQRTDAALGNALQGVREYLKAKREEQVIYIDLIPPMHTWSQTLEHALGLVDQMAPSLGRMNEQLARQQREIRGVLEQAGRNLDVSRIFDSAQIGTALGNAISGAIQGGGDIFASAAGALGQSVTSRLSRFLTTARDSGGFGLSGLLGGMVSSVLPGLGALVGPLVGKLTDTLRDAFGGPSRNELLGRDVVAQFEQTLQGTLTAAQKLAAGNESWKLTTIAVSQAYVAAGRSSAEAEKAVAKLWASSKSGADASRLAVLEIQAVMDIAAAKQKEIAESQTDSAKDLESATSGIQSRIQELTSEYDALFNSIKNEAPEEKIGVVERLTRERMRAIAAERTGLETEMDRVTRGVEDNLGGLGAKAEDAARDIEDALSRIRIEPIRVPVEVTGASGFDIPALKSGGIVRKPTLALIGESGPEAVVPLGSGGFEVSDRPIVLKAYFDGREAAEAFVPHIPHVVRRRT